MKRAFSDRQLCQMMSTASVAEDGNQSDSFKSETDSFKSRRSDDSDGYAPGSVKSSDQSTWATRRVWSTHHRDTEDAPSRAQPSVFGIAAAAAPTHAEVTRFHVYGQQEGRRGERRGSHTPATPTLMVIGTAPACSPSAGGAASMSLPGCGVCSGAASPIAIPPGPAGSMAGGGRAVVAVAPTGSKQRAAGLAGLTALSRRR